MTRGNPPGGQPVGAELDPGVRDLVAAACRGDEAGFERLYRLHVGRVYAISLRLTADTERAERLTQDVFVRAWERLASYRGSGTFWGWLRRVTMNVVLDDRRAALRRALWPEAGDREDERAIVHPAQTETWIELERAIAALPEGARMVFVLHDVCGYAYKEIAEQAGVALGTVKAQLHRARKLLRDALAGPLEVRTS